MTLEMDFPCSLIIDVPFPNARLASTALRALRVDEELSPLVRRSFLLGSTGSGGSSSSLDGTFVTNGAPYNDFRDEEHFTDETKTVLRTHYRATTNRMLRVSVNGFFESLGVVLQVMQELDVDMLAPREANQRSNVLQ